MIKLLKKVRLISSKLFKILVPSYIRIRLDGASFGILKFIEVVSKQVKPSDKVLDAGGGACPYKKYFSHAKYESTDFDNMFKEDWRTNHDFICSLDNIPKPDNSYDVIINTQVLEHVEYPQKVINEFYRILKPGGKLFLTAPQGWGLHGVPYHFFNFTKYGLKSLFGHAKFKIVFIKPMGGMFLYLGKRIKKVPQYIFFQYLIEKDRGNIKLKLSFKTFLLFPFYLISLPFCEFLIPLLFFYLDKLDKKQDFTLNYACYCIK